VSRRVKLVCTLGPKSSTPRLVRALAEMGGEVFRINFSHGTPMDHAKYVEVVRKVETEIDRELAVLADLPGPKIRLGGLDGEPVRLMAGGRFALRGRPGPGDATGAGTTYPPLARDLRKGDRVLLADGAVELVVREVDDVDVVTEVVRGGSIRSRAGLNVPAERLSVPAITDRDREGLAHALDLGADLVAQSFVRTGADVRISTRCGRIRCRGFSPRGRTVPQPSSTRGRFIERTRTGRVSAPRGRFSTKCTSARSPPRAPGPRLPPNCRS